MKDSPHTTMSTRKRDSLEDRVAVDDRLTGKHIRTLIHLQDVTGEGERLKHRVAYLEICEVKAQKCDLLEKEVQNLKSELLKCKEIHETAQMSKEKLQEMQKECLAKIDKSNRQLAYRHEQEMMRLVSEKLEEENSWAVEKQKFAEKIRDLENENSSLNVRIKDLENSNRETEVSRTQLQESQSIVESYKKENRELQEAKLAFQKGIRELTCQNDTLQTSLTALNTKVKVLEVQARQAKKAQDMTTKCEPPEDLKPELQRLTDQIQQLDKLITDLKKDNEEKQQVIGSLEFNLQDSAQSLKHLYKERDLLKNRIAGLLSEIEILKYQAPEPRQTFTEYVKLRRDFTSLRDEHEKLMKKRGSRPNILPCLKADSKTIARTVSGNSLNSRTNSS